MVTLKVNADPNPGASAVLRNILQIVAKYLKATHCVLTAQADILQPAMSALN